MTREIKFRAWSEDTRSWITNGVLRKDGALCDVGSSGDLYVKTGHVVVMQYTGLKSKSGQEIFEGDILKHWSTADFSQNRYPVVFKDGHFWLQYGENNFGHILAESMEVIGNIYENPELLEVENK